MEVFIAAREADDVVKVMRQLNALGVHGRDAAYLASTPLPCPSDPSAQESFARDLRFMVGPDQREAAARLIGFPIW